MTSLLHIVDTDSVQKDPNLDFDPQNPSAFLAAGNTNHPEYKELIEGLTPEQQEILSNVSGVAGEDEDIVEDDNFTVVNPETGEEEELPELKTSLLEDIGFVDPDNMKKITLEAFYDHSMLRAFNTCMEAHNSVDLMHQHLRSKGFVSRSDADQLNALTGGAIGDNIAMESFTKIPTKTNFSLVMEESNGAKIALQAGAAIAGGVIIYKLIKWFLNSWNKNGVASESIRDNIARISQRKDRIKNADNIIAVANSSLQKTIQEFADSDDLEDRNLLIYLRKLQANGQLKDPAEALKALEKVNEARAIRNMQPIYSNLWASISGEDVKIGGVSFKVTEALFKAIPDLISECTKLQGVVNNQTEAIATSGGDAAIPDRSAEYMKALETFRNFGKLLAYENNSKEIHVYTQGLMQHVQSNITAPLGYEYIIKSIPKAEGLAIIDPLAWRGITDEYAKTVVEFDKDIKDLNGDKETVTILGKIKNEKTVGVDNKAAVQKDSRIREYEKLVQAFRAAMMMMRVLLALRNNIGKGLNALDSASAAVYGNK